MSRNVAISFALGNRDLAEKSRYLIKSINTFTENTEIYTFLPEEESHEISERDLQFFKTNTICKCEPIPIEGYPISAKIAAMEHATDMTNREYVVLLDTDTLVLNEIDCHKSSHEDLFVKPADGDNHHWVQNRSKKDWQNAYSMLGRDFPGFTHRTTISKKPIPPYWNAGFVMTSDFDFPGTWLSETFSIYESELPARFFSDQVALGSISTDYSVKIISELYNYPLPLRYRTPKNIRVLHYHDYQPCGRVLSPTIRHNFREIGITQSASFPSRCNQIRLMIGLGKNIFKQKF